MATTRGVFQMRIPRGEEDVPKHLQALAEETGKSQSQVVRDLVREAVAKRREETQRRWPHLFESDGDNPPGEAA